MSAKAETRYERIRRAEKHTRNIRGTITRLRNTQWALYDKTLADVLVREHYDLLTQALDTVEQLVTCMPDAFFEKDHEYEINDSDDALKAAQEIIDKIRWRRWPGEQRLLIAKLRYVVGREPDEIPGFLAKADKLERELEAELEKRRAE